jgi:dipeptidyl aminopeptidase/acylaminoacyl peptidase
MKYLILITMLVSSANSISTLAQQSQGYMLPPKEILNLADYASAPTVMMDSKNRYMLFSYRNTYKTLEDLYQEEMSLGGLRINPVTNISSTITYVNNLKLKRTSDKSEVQIAGLPSDCKLSNFSWSPNEEKIAFTHTTKTGVELWVLDLASATANKLTEANVNANLGNPINWYSDSKAVLLRMLPSNRIALIDRKKELATGPTVSESDGVASQNRTYQDLLKNATDETNFEIIATSELYKIDLFGKAELYKKADMYVSETISPDGKYVMVTTVHRPFSYIVPYGRFPLTSNVYDISGKLTALVNEVPLTEIMPKGFSSVRKGKRSMQWRSDAAATLVYVVALDEGDQAVKVEYRDEVLTWEAPFVNQAKSLVKTKQRFGGIQWGKENCAIVSDSWYDTRNESTYCIDPSDPKKSPRLIWDRNYQDIYSDPGDFEMKKNNLGKYVIAFEGETALLLGSGHTKDGQFPFIDQFNFLDFKSKRLYTSNIANKMEDLLFVTDIKKGEVLVRVQSKNEYPNYFLRSYKSKGTPRQLTFFKNPFESMAQVHKEVIKYKRADGVALTGTLYLPAGYDRKKKEKLPLLIWAYPTEYKDKNSAGQSTQNPNAFTFPYYGSFVYWAMRGYAVLDDAAFPIIGEDRTEPNDNFMEQLVANAKAAIDAVDSLGYINRTKVAVGGHSYGAFMTANLLTHSKLFACGIARSGAYNRTLTPFGFQSEQRNYWDIPAIYNGMSPFMNADKMKTPLLLVHGEADNNPGTFTLQTERYFQALKGLGAPVRMVILPKESHGYVAKENIFHLLWEQDQFLEKYLKSK